MTNKEARTTKLADGFTAENTAGFPDGGGYAYRYLITNPNGTPVGHVKVVDGVDDVVVTAYNPAVTAVVAIDRYDGRFNLDAALGKAAVALGEAA